MTGNVAHTITVAVTEAAAAEGHGPISRVPLRLPEEGNPEERLAAACAAAARSAIAAARA